MATISNAIQITNGTAKTLNSINKSVNNVINSFKVLRVESGRAIDTRGISSAASKLSNIEKSFDNIKNAISATTGKMKTFNSTIISGINTTAKLSKMTNSFNNTKSQISGAAGKKKTFVSSFQEGVAGVSGFADKVKGVASSIWPAVKSGMSFSDSYARQASNLEAVNDGSQSPAALQNKVFAAAQNSRSSYDGTVATVTKLGSMSKDDFKTNDEAIYFTELMNKSFSGVDASSAASGIDQITQAMVSGKLQGEDLMSVMEKAPMLAKSISKYTGKSPEELMAGDGVSDDVIKNAVFSSAGDINTAFLRLPITFEKVWTSIKNSALIAFQPVIEKIGEITKSGDFQTMITGICGSFNFLKNLALEVVSVVSGIAGVIVDHWSFIGPIIWGVIAAMAAYKVATFLGAAATTVITAAKLAALPIYAFLTGATIANTAAQWGLNSALYSCPIVWIIMIIIALIVIVYLVVAAINKFAGTSISATGVIAGYFSMLGTSIYNVFVLLWNHVASFIEFFANVFTNPVYSIKRLFVNVFTNILDFIKATATAIDMVFGSNLAGGIASLKSEMQGWISEVPKNYTVVKRLEMKNLDNAYSNGYKWGQNLENSFDISKITGGDTNAFPANNYLQNDIAKTAANTGAMKNSMDVSEEDLKYMRDIAEQEVINRFTTSEIKVDMTNNNNINSNLDLDGVVSYMEQKVNESLMISAEGAHN